MTARPDIWGGVECSIVRIGDAVRNQLQDTGHATRRGDMALLASLGIRRIRYPVLWEMVESRAGDFDWHWTDARLGDLRQHGIAVIAGLLHHGSGPPWTNPLADDFPQALARYAGEVARRYPWLDMFTPVNEPFTTARLCGLYGLWHPHARNEAACFRITVAQCLAIALAMRSIRDVTPHAQLVQTEDFGRIHATMELAPQAAYENERRWLSIDLLAGRVDRHHPFHHRLLEAGVPESHLARLHDAPCAPDIIGIDYYLTSDRMLDDRTHLHTDEHIGGNGHQAYVDIAAVRAGIASGRAGLRARLDEIWQRYGLPIAITELHNGCSRDEQLRWLMEGWQAACEAAQSGIDVRAITSWSLFGAMDWNTMLTRHDGYYECGAFDARHDPPRPTVVASAIASLAAVGEFDHPALDRPGWWHAHETSCHGARPLVLFGFGRNVSDVEACCNRRRLRVVPSRDPHIASALQAHGAWGAIRLGSPSHPLHRTLPQSPRQLECHYENGKVLTLHLPLQAEWTEFLDTFLDLVMDQHHGVFRCHSAYATGVAGARADRIDGAQEHPAAQGQSC